MDDDGSDVPPLEDMSELLEQVQQLQRVKEKTVTNRLRTASAAPSSASVKTVPPGGSRQIRVTKSTSGDNKSNPNNLTESAKVTTKSSSSFGGMKKGFLFGSPNKSSKPKPKQLPSAPDTKQNKCKALERTSEVSDDIPFIKPQNDSSEFKGHQIPEVQEALKASGPFLQNKEWVNDDLLSEIEKHPRLAKQLVEPRFSQAVAMFQTNPQGAMQYYQHNPDVQTFFQDFCGILGDHFSKLSPSKESSSSHSLGSPEQPVKVHEETGADMSLKSSTNPNRPTSADEAKMRQIMSDPEVIEVFSDPKITQLVEALRLDPDKAQRMMHTADTDAKRKIQKLVDVGLLGFAR